MLAGEGGRHKHTVFPSPPLSYKREQAVPFRMNDSESDYNSRAPCTGAKVVLPPDCCSPARLDCLIIALSHPGFPGAFPSPSRDASNRDTRQKTGRSGSRARPAKGKEPARIVYCACEAGAAGQSESGSWFLLGRAALRVVVVMQRDRQRSGCCLFFLLLQAGSSLAASVGGVNLPLVINTWPFRKATEAGAVSLPPGFGL